MYMQHLAENIMFSKCMGLILVEWETKVMRLESGPVHSAGGRPRNVVNVELVRGFNLYSKSSPQLTPPLLVTIIIIIVLNT